MKLTGVAALLVLVSVIAFGLGWLASGDRTRSDLDHASNRVDRVPAIEQRTESVDPQQFPVPKGDRETAASPHGQNAVRLNRDLPCTQGGGRSSPQIFRDGWGSDFTASGLGAEGPPWPHDEEFNDSKNGPLGEVGPWLGYDSGLFESLFDSQGQTRLVSS